MAAVTARRVRVEQERCARVRESRERRECEQRTWRIEWVGA